MTVLTTTGPATARQVSEYSISPTNPAATHATIWVTAAPEGSAWATELAASDASRVQVFDGPKTGTWRWQPDKGGVYHFAIEEWNRGTGYRGGYDGSPQGQDTSTRLGSSVVTVTVASRLTIRVGTGEHTADLVLYVRGDVLMDTTKSAHGEDSPALINPTTTRAKAATLHATVVASLAALRVAGLTSLQSIVGGSPAEGLELPVRLLATAMASHMGSTTFHAHADADNQPTSEERNPGTTATTLATIIALGQRLQNHTNNMVTPKFDGSGNLLDNAPHAQGSAPQYLVPTPARTDLPGLLLAFADCYRAFSLHRATTSPVHLVADAVNTNPTTLPPLIALQLAFQQLVVASSPPALPTQHAAAPRLIAQAGAVEA